MLIKTPNFWRQKNIFAYLLLPLSLVYQVFAAFADFLPSSKKINKKVICIGNITLGGSGKTPVAIAIGKILHEIGINFSYLSRGYRGNVDFTYVDDNSCSKNVGDEPLILAEIAPTFISKNRVKGALNLAQIDDLQAIILDDGLQNNSLKKDFSILVIDNQIQFGNGFVFPAGPLRQSISQGLKQADLVIVIGDKIDDNLQQTLITKKVFLAQIKAKNLDNFKGQKLLAFCGIAYPEKFFSFLENQGLQLIGQQSFADHHFYSQNELLTLQEQAKNFGAKLITTKKDWVKFPLNFQQEIDFFDIDLEFVNAPSLKNELQKIFTNA